MVEGTRRLFLRLQNPVFASSLLSSDPFSKGLTSECKSGKTQILVSLCTNGSMIPLVCSVVSTGITAAAGQAPIFSAFFPRRPWETAEWVSVLQHLFNSSEWFNSSNILSSVPSSPSRCQSADVFPPLSLINVPTRSPSPRLSLRADVDALSAHRRGLSAWPSGSSHGFLPATAG